MTDKELERYIRKSIRAQLDGRLPGIEDRIRKQTIEQVIEEISTVDVAGDVGKTVAEITKGLRSLQADVGELDGRIAAVVRAAGEAKDAPPSKKSGKKKADKDEGPEEPAASTGDSPG
jgi:uncharacterized coiled-coil DUF342 family protein